MQIIRAKHAGFCFGVKRAVDKTLQLAKEGKKLCTLGDLIHNTIFVEYLKEKGIRSVESLLEVQEGECVVIRSHGVAPECYEQLEAQGISYVDCTCPFVARIHERVSREKSCHDAIIIIGKAEHPEVVGIKGWAGENAYVVASPEDIRHLPPVNTALVVCQTTIRQELADALFSEIQQRIPGAELFNSICETTRQRQEETRLLAQKSDAMVVIGDKKSSNTRKLYEIALKFCNNTQYIESVDELLLEKFLNCDIISIVAGASAPDWIIREVETQMSEFEHAQVAEEEVKAAEEQAEATEAAVEAEEAAAVEAEDQDKNDENTDFLAELEKTFVKIRRGQFVKGVVVQVSDDEVCVNIGYKSDGIIRKEDLTAEGDVSPADMFQPGDEIEAEVITLNDGEGNVRLSRKKIESQLKWKELIDNLDPEKTYECKVVKVIKGGVLSKLEGYDAFIPASQLSLKYIEDLSVFVGQTLEVKIIDIDKRQKRFVLSHKEVLKAQQEEAEKKIFASFEKGAVVKGVVKRLTDFGAFVDVGGVDGLLHITDISWVRIKHPKDVLQENQEIEVKILNVDPEKKKISLGYKQLQPRPWDLVPEKYLVGDTVEGKVVRIAPFGAFVELEPTVEGLVHISQVANRRIEKVEDVLNVGDVVNAKILEVNGEKRRISLSIRALLDTPKQEVADTQDDAAEESSYSGKKRDREERISYTLPPVEEAKTSLADLFPKMDD